MSFDLPRIHVRTESFDPAVMATCPEFSPELANRLAGLDRGTVPVGTTGADRCVAIGPRIWSIGERRGDDTVWRLVRAGDAERIGGHPAWLWTAEAWFDPALGRDARARVPNPSPLRQLVRLMAPLGGRSRRTVQALAATLAALRAPGAAPVAVVVERDLLSSASHPARWFVLALLAILPPGRRDSLRISIGETNPSPVEFDLVLTPSAPPGFALVDAADPPEECDDLVAYYVGNRLTDDDPEALEAAAYLFDGEGDRWGDGIAALIRDGLPGVSEVTDEMIDQDPGRAVSALAARLHAGAPVDGGLLDQLVRITRKTHDPRPWRALARRPPMQRADAVDALLAIAASLRPTGELVTVLSGMYPRGAPLELWIPALMGWLRDGVDPDAVSDAVLTTLAEWPFPPNAAAVTAEVVRQLLELGRPELAAAALSSPVAQQVVTQGGGAALNSLWGAVGAAAPEQLSAYLAPLVSADAPVGDAGDQIAQVFGFVKDRRPLGMAVLRAWLSRDRTVSAEDPLFQAVRQSDYLGDWAELVVSSGAAAVVPENDAGWQTVADVVAGSSDSARHGLLSLAEVPTPAGQERALPMLLGLLEDARFPDPALSEAAEQFAGADGALAIWGLVSVVAAAPDAWSDATVDATVVEFCASRLDSTAVGLGRAAMAALGRAESWEPLDHARWVVRIALAPPGIGNVPLIASLLRGVRARPDAVRFMAGLLSSMMDLPPDHEACLMLLEQLPEAGWQGTPLNEVIEQVGSINIPLSLRRTLVAISEMG